jgi:hypothetical protein
MVRRSCNTEGGSVEKCSAMALARSSQAFNHASWNWGGAKHAAGNRLEQSENPVDQVRAILEVLEAIQDWEAKGRPMNGG